MERKQRLGLLSLLCLTLSAGQCNQSASPPSPPSPPDLLTGSGLTPTLGPSLNPSEPSFHGNVRRWEGESEYYWRSDPQVGGGIRANPFAIRLVINAGFLAGNEVYVEDASTTPAQRLEKIDITAAPDRAKSQFAIGFDQNPASPNNPFYYMVISPRWWPTGTIEHGKKLKFRIVQESSAGRAATDFPITYIAAGRCRASTLDVPASKIKPGESAAVNWGATGCKAAVVSAQASSSGGTIGVPGGSTGVPDRMRIGGDIWFARKNAAHDADFSGSRTQFNIRQDWSVALYAVDATWSGGSGSPLKRKIEQEAASTGTPTTPTTGCPNNAQPQNFDYCVSCPTGLPGGQPYEYSLPGYAACSAIAAETEIKSQYGGCTVKAGVC